MQSPPKGITVPYRPLKPVTVATNLGHQQAGIAAAAVNNPAATAGGFLPVSHAAAGQYTAAAAAAASLNPAAATAHAALIPASAQVRQKLHSLSSLFYHVLSFFSPQQKVPQSLTNLH